MGGCVVPCPSRQFLELDSALVRVADERVTLEPIYCLGLCATAPSAMLDGRVVGRLNEARIDALIAEALR